MAGSVELASQATHRCPNCGAQLVGDYCHVCGQKQVDADWLSVAPFIRRFANELAHLDFKSVRSLVALLRPGYLAEGFLAGRRRRYLNPLKLYFVSAALYFLAAPSVSGFTLEDLLRQDRDGRIRAMVERRMAQEQIDSALFAERFNLRLQTVYTLSLGISVIAAALILRGLYGRKAPAFGTHVVFALYYVSFLYVLALAVGAFHRALGEPHPLLALALSYAILIPYVFLALKRVYRDPAGRTLVKCLVLLTAAFVIDAAVNVGAIRLTMALT